MKSLNTNFAYWLIASYTPDRENFEGERDSKIQDKSILIMTNRDITLTHENDNLFGYCPLIDDFIEIPMRSVTMIVQPQK